MKSNELKGLIVAKGYMIKDLSEKMKISTQSISKKLNGKTQFNLEDIKKLMEILDIPNEDIAKYFL